ncbi:histone-like nucleoid-structuring protein Lsr2 [Paractinoplanes durhamensis]|uniref:Lsr2 family protein n=1 Tax=Paractinoplanes durhamensis TaxID=113563 RepID=A0ABQ3Z0R2_9ACTN|nr:Lsr2 family protein [Actinoplanes durhamensis]GIE03417.1 Lsr2 family protein [Actinoplanes durhamensis]
MAIRIQRTVVDDIDGTDSKVATYRFALEGIEYEIDLSDPNIDELRAVLRPYTTAGRRLPKTRTKTGSAARTAPGTKSSPVRQWWYAHQGERDLPPFNPRGSIPHQVIAAKRDADQP